jgi:hypothetical protein
MPRYRPERITRKPVTIFYGAGASGSTDPRAGHVIWSEVEVDPAARHGSLLWAEFEVGTAAREGRLAWATLETTSPPRSGRLDWAEVEIGVVPRSGALIWTEFSVGSAPRTGRLSWTEFKTGDVPRKGRLFWTELDVPDITTEHGRLIWAQFRIPNLPTAPGEAWPTVILPDVESLVVQYLKQSDRVSALVDGRVSGDLPSRPTFPAVTVLLVSDNVPIEQHLTGAWIQLDCFGTTREEARLLARTVQAVMSAWAGEFNDAVVHCETIIGVRRMPEPEDNRARYQVNMRVWAHN